MRDSASSVPGETVPDANARWDLSGALIAARVLDELFAPPDRQFAEAGYLPTAGQIIDGTMVATPRQRNTDAKKVV